MTAPKVLVVTNDFPPTLGGIQTYVRDYLAALTEHASIRAANIVVFASTQDKEQAEKFDAQVGYTVVRWRRKIMLPTPATARKMIQLIKQHKIDTVWFAAAAPLAVMAPQARKAGATRVVASTHGHEVGWSMFPGARGVLRHIGKNVDALTFVSRYVRGRIANVFGPNVAWEPMPGGVDTGVFRPQIAMRDVLRERYGIADKRVIVAVSRVVPRKGQDTLVRVIPQIVAAVPDAHLVIAGPGEYAAELEVLAGELGVAEHVTFTGAVQYEELPSHYAMGDIFALPVRTQGSGLSVEGLGIVFLEAQAAGLPTVAGNGGGAPETVIDGVTGRVVDSRDDGDVAACLIALLNDATHANALATAGRDRVKRAWQWRVLAQQLDYVLRGHTADPSDPPPRHSWSFPVSG